MFGLEFGDESTSLQILTEFLWNHKDKNNNVLNLYFLYSMENCKCLFVFADVKVKELGLMLIGSFLGQTGFVKVTVWHTGLDRLWGRTVGEALGDVVVLQHRHVLQSGQCCPPGLLHLHNKYKCVSVDFVNSYCIWRMSEIRVLRRPNWRLTSSFSIFSEARRVCNCVSRRLSSACTWVWDAIWVTWKEVNQPQRLRDCRQILILIWILTDGCTNFIAHVGLKVKAWWWTEGCWVKTQQTLTVSGRVQTLYCSLQNLQTWPPGGFQAQLCWQVGSEGSAQTGVVP